MCPHVHCCILQLYSENEHVNNLQTVTKPVPLNAKKSKYNDCFVV